MDQEIRSEVSRRFLTIIGKRSVRGIETEPIKRNRWRRANQVTPERGRNSYRWNPNIEEKKKTEHSSGVDGNSQITNTKKKTRGFPRKQSLGIEKNCWGGGNHLLCWKELSHQRVWYSAVVGRKTPPAYTEWEVNQKKKGTNSRIPYRRKNAED